MCRPNRIVRAHLSRGDRNRTSICVCEPNEAAITTVTPDRPSVSSIKLQPGGVTAFLVFLEAVEIQESTGLHLKEFL